MENSIREKGYAILDLSGLEYFKSIQDMLHQHFPCAPTELHQHESMSHEQRCCWIKEAKDALAKSNFFYSLLKENLDIFIKLLGPDIDMQSGPYLRVARPNLDEDAIGWHRDTFYGNSFWECNLWMPVFPLEKESGLLVIEGSHAKPSTNTRYITEKNSFRREVIKGSIANEIGYLYASKTDDIISECENQPSMARLLTPKLGQAIFFFGYLAHCPYNASARTRVTIDSRLKSMSAATNTKQGYYRPLTRGSIGDCVEHMMRLNM